MQETRKQVETRVRERLNGKMKILRVEDGLIFEHRNARHFLAEIDLRGRRLTVPLSADFLDHPDWEDEELVEQAMKVLRPRLQRYHRRGYRIREMEWQPGYQSPTYDEHQRPIFLAYLERELDDWDELFEELPWLLEQLPER